MRARRLAHVLRMASAALVFATAMPPAGAQAAPPGAVPVLCTAIVSPGTAVTFTCRRQDTDSAFNGVPTGSYLHVTDVTINRNSLATTGEYYATIGRENGDFPAEPRIATSGTPLRATKFHFETPVIVLEGLEALSVRNDSSSDFGLNVYASGFLADTVLVPEPGEHLMLAAGVGSVALLGALRRGRRGLHGPAQPRSPSSAIVARGRAGTRARW